MWNSRSRFFMTLLMPCRMAYTKSTLTDELMNVSSELLAIFLFHSFLLFLLRTLTDTTLLTSALSLAGSAQQQPKNYTWLSTKAWNKSGSVKRRRVTSMLMKPTMMTDLWYTVAVFTNVL